MLECESKQTIHSPPKKKEKKKKERTRRCLTKNRDAGSRPRWGRVVRVLEATLGGERSNERNEERQLAARDARLVIFPSPGSLGDSPYGTPQRRSLPRLLPVFSDTLPIAPRDIPSRRSRAQPGHCSTHHTTLAAETAYAITRLASAYARIRTRQLVPSIADTFQLAREEIIERKNFVSRRE